MASFNHWSAALLCFFSVSVCAQSISNINAEMDNLNGAVHVTYDLLSKNAGKRYKVELLCSEDGGATFADPLVGVSGDVGYNVKAGTSKKINWAYFVDLPDFKGKNVVFKVVAKEDIEYRENIILSLGGPEKFYQSVLVPGYGNYHVRKGKGYMAITAAVGVLIGSGIYLKYQSKNYYDDYLASTTPEMASDNFSKANSLARTSNILLGSGAAIWTIDVGQVLMKGILNRKRQQQILLRRQK